MSYLDNNVGYSETANFEVFKKEHPTYLEQLKEKTELIFNAYTLVCDMRFSKINKIPEMKELTERLAFGMLFRHAAESITASLATEIGIDPTDKTVDQRLEALKGHTVCGYNRQKEEILYITKNFSNEAAHCKVINPNLVPANDLRFFYANQLKGVLDSHIIAIKSLSGGSLKKIISTPAITRELRKGTNKYVIAIKRELDNFKISNKITYSLLRCCLIRQLIECTVNLWCYNQNLTPTDYSSSISGADSIHSKLVSLSHIAQYNNPEFAALNSSVIDNLFKLKETTNYLMHVDIFTVKNILERSRDIHNLHPIVESECSPQVIMAKFASVKGIKLNVFNKRAAVSVLLCGTAGWLGAHEFYAGNIGTGIRSVLRFLWGALCILSTTSGNVPPLLALIFALWPIVSPLLSLFELKNGSFSTKKWGVFTASKWVSVLSVVFTLLHLYIDYLLIVKVIF